MYEGYGYGQYPNILIKTLLTQHYPKHALSLSM